MIVAAGPNTSVACTASRCAALGLQQGRRDESGLVAVDAVELRRVGAAGDDLGFARQLPRCPRARPSAGRASPAGPCGSPRGAGRRPWSSASRADSASATASARSAGTKTRRMAVHFCPAFCVISRATSLMKASKAGVAAATSGASSAALTLSASTFTRTPRVSMLRWPAMRSRGVRRAGERDHVVRRHVIEQVADAAARAG